MAQPGDVVWPEGTSPESEQLFRVMAETSADIIRMLTPEGHVLYASPSAVRLLGKFPRTQFENIHPDDLDRARRWWKSLLAGGSDRLEWRVHDAKGEYHSFETWGHYVEYRGRPNILTFCRDVTERVETVQRLREAQRKVEDAARIAHIGYWDNDLTTDRITWSLEMYRILGLEPGEVEPTQAMLRERIHPDDLVVHDELNERRERGEWRYDTEFRMVRPSGDVRTIRAVGDVVRDASGQPTRAFGVIQDVTERQQNERALQESHGLLKAVVEGTSDAIFAKGVDGRYLMMNTTGARFLGKTAEQVIGKTDAELFPPEAARAIGEKDREVMESGQSQTFEEEMTMEGVHRTYVATKSAYRDEKGKVIGLVGISSDVTALKRLEEQFRQAQKMEAVGRLAGGVAHDFNNLLTVINSYSQMLMDDRATNDPARELLGEILQAGQRAATLTRQLLAFSRKQLLQPRVVNLNAVLQELLNLLRRLIGEDVDVSLIPDVALGLTRIDPLQFEQAIINLAVNARDAMPGGGRLTIETSNVELGGQDAELPADVPAGRYVLVSVRDTGHGIDVVTLPRVFEPFFTTKEVGKGTGLGLAMVYGFVKQSGGHIEIISTLGQGATIKIYLPRTLDAAVAAPAREVLAVSSGTETVLLVEDENAVRGLSKLVLESHGYTVLEARHGQEAIDLVEHDARAIHILVTDVVMPVMSGRQLAERMATSRPGMRVLYISGYTDDAVLPLTVPGTKIAFLQKPFTPIDLVQKVREVLDSL